MSVGLTTLNKRSKIILQKICWLGGMKEIKFSPEDEKWYINMAYTEGWKAALEKSQRVKELQPLVSK